MVAFLGEAIPLHTGLLVSFLTTYLAGSSGLRPYDLSTNNDPHLASSDRLPSAFAGEALTTYNQCRNGLCFFLIDIWI